jgi:hypothetical protein
MKRRVLNLVFVKGLKFLKKTVWSLVCLICGFSALAQTEYDYYVGQVDSTVVEQDNQQLTDSIRSLTDVHYMSDSPQDLVGISMADSTYQAQFGNVKDSIAEIQAFITSLEDSLPGFQILRRIDEKRTELLDSLSTMQLPQELTNTVDSLRSLPNIAQDLHSHLDFQKYQSADTLVTRYIDKARDFISDQQQKMEDKASSLLPEEFYSKVEHFKSKAGTGDMDMDALSKVDKLTSKYELDYKKYLSVAQLQEYLNMDMEFLNNMDGYLDQLGKYSGKFEEYMGELNSYMGKSDLNGLADHDLTNLEQYSDQLDLPGDMQLEGFAELDGINAEEVENLISEYGTMDAETLDQRIDQMASKYEEVGALHEQVSAFEGMQAGQLGELEQMKSYAGMKFDEKMALKQGQVLANEQLIENADIVQTAMKELDAFKKKYAIVTNSNFKEEDVEQPTKHVQLQKRFFYGGDFQLLPGAPFGIDFSGLLGYKVANRISIGLAGSVRYEFEESENYLPDFNKEPVYGGRAFLQYTVIKAFFLQGEAEAANAYNDNQQKIWEINYLAGIGRSMTIKDKLKLNVTFLYHINNKGSYAHDRPFVIRVGFSSK